MELREVLVILGVVLIAVIVWDGLRRMQGRKANKYRGGYTHDPEELKKQAEIARELPNGGARVRNMTEEEREDLSSKLNLRERVPMLMDSVEQEVPAEREPDQPESEAVEQGTLDFEAPPREPDPEPEAESSAGFEDHSEEDEVHFTATDDFEPEPETPDIAETNDEDVERAPEPASEPDPEPVAETEPDTEQEPEVEASPIAHSRLERDEPEPQYQEDTRPVEELVIIHVMARDGGELPGSDLLELLIRAGLRFGPLDIFHYRNPKGQMEFSLANCVQPGTLNPDAMDQFTTPGVTLFMQLPLHADMMEAFDHMYEMALFLAKHLDAVVVDEEHSTVTPQRVEHYRERLRNFARSQLIQAHE
ncbi:cell division protein ZipA [Saccharospirillum salsuginis]|uniref:Cell division protein ZipA n=1 Tax=Saccharospirillum salsuginis TaxID=418750 RepID=A0A918KVP4_9GAMM|nr:cell division protein ZipA [Saccharospirillum salsuginis]GGX75694.1 hypothetical protein GCM10007392_48490 [Saccharospirillum salsuginis]